MRAAVHVGQLLQPVPGGIGRYVRSLVRALPGVGVEVAAFAAGPEPEGLGAPYHRLGRPGGSLRYELWHRLRWPAVPVPGDLLHATSLAVPPAGGRPLVVSVHDLVFLRTPEHLTPRGVAFHRRGLELARREARVWTVLTEFGKQDLAREGFDPQRIHVTPMGVDLPSEPADPAPVLERLAVRPPFLLFVSTIEPRKGLDDLLAAHARLRTSTPELQLVVAGDRGWGPVPDLTGAGVVPVGRVGDDALDALYRAATALALPARYEGFGMSTLEAMARGCPVVVSDTSCLPEVVGDAAAVVPVGDVDALTDALHELVQGGPLHDRLAAAGPGRAAGFTWRRCAEATRAAYEAAVAP